MTRKGKSNGNWDYMGVVGCPNMIGLTVRVRLEHVGP